MRIFGLTMIFYRNNELNKIRGIFGRSRKIEKFKLHMYFIESRQSQQRRVDEPNEPNKLVKKKKAKFSKTFKHFNLKLALKTGW